MSIYCVYITSYSGNKLPPFYIGSTSKLKILNGYKGSVVSKKYKTVWQSEIADNPHLFKTTIIFETNHREAAFEKEKSLQVKLNIITNPMYINQCIANSPIGTCNKGVKKTDSHIKNMSISQLARYARIGHHPSKGKTLGKRPGVGEKIMNSKKLNGTDNNTRLGFKASEHTKQKQRVAALNRPKIQCEHCNTLITKQVYSRYHNGKCSSAFSKGIADASNLISC